MTVEVKTSVRFNTWQVPNFATVTTPPRPKQEGMQAAPTIAIGDLDVAALDALAAAWLEELYKKAGQSNPFAQINRGS